jgi:hypothetical protein
VNRDGGPANHFAAININSRRSRFFLTWTVAQNPGLWKNQIPQLCLRSGEFNEQCTVFAPLKEFVAFIKLLHYPLMSGLLVSHFCPRVENMRHAMPRKTVKVPPSFQVMGRPMKLVRPKRRAQNNEKL